MGVEMRLIKYFLMLFLLVQIVPAAPALNSADQAVFKKIDNYLDNSQRDKAKTILAELVKQGNSKAAGQLGMLLFWEKNPQGLQLLNEAAKKGDVHAQVFLATFYVFGAEGIPKNPSRGFTILQTYAEAGDVFAMSRLGGAYISVKNFAEGVKWLKRAADAQPADNNERDAVGDAQQMLGTAYLAGLGVEADCFKAMEYFRLAAKNENPTAVVYLKRLQTRGCLHK